MNCTELDNLVERLTVSVAHHDVGFGISLVLLFGVSIALLAYGERLVRPLAAILGGLFGAGGAFFLSGLFERPLPCEARLGIAGVSGVIVAVLTICILKTGLFLLGAFGLGSVVHLVWESLPLESVSGPFTIFSRPGWYYIAVGTGGIVGAIVSQLQKKSFTRIASSVLGGSGVAAGVYLIYERNDSMPPPLLLLIVVLSCSIFGTIIQHYTSKWRKDRKERKKLRRIQAREMVPIGRPVE